MATKITGCAFVGSGSCEAYFRNDQKCYTLLVIDLLLYDGFNNAEVGGVRKYIPRVRIETTIRLLQAWREVLVKSLVRVRAIAVIPPL